MRKTTILTALLLILGFGTVAAQGTYGIDSAHSSVGFKVRHLVSKVSGGFNEFEISQHRHQERKTGRPSPLGGLLRCREVPRDHI